MGFLHTRHCAQSFCAWSLWILTATLLLVVLGLFCRWGNWDLKKVLNDSMYLISKKTWFIAESPESSFSHSLPLPRPSPSSHLCHHDQYSKYLQWLQKSPYALLEGFPSPGSIRSSVSADSVCPGSREKMMGMGLDQTHLPCLALRLSISASSELLLKQGQTLMTIHLC